MLLRYPHFIPVDRKIPSGKLKPYIFNVVGYGVCGAPGEEQPDEALFHVEDY